MNTLTDDDIDKIRNRDTQNELEWLGAPSDGVPAAQGFVMDPKWQKKFQLDFSVPISAQELQEAHSKGMLRKRDLQDGKYYWGACRNVHVARWSAKDSLFYHRRWKGEWFTESIPFPGDEETFEMDDGRRVGFDIFIPWLEVEPLPHECVQELKGQK